MSDASTPAGWYPDGSGGQRWWDGSTWTAHYVAPDRPNAVPPEKARADRRLTWVIVVGVLVGACLLAFVADALGWLDLS